MQPTPSVLFYALCNARKRYFIPSKENYFGGIKIEYCTLDSGANSMLLPCNQAILSQITMKFDDNPRFKWDICPSGGFGALSSPILSIMDYGPGFEIELSKDDSNYCTKLEYLRFHLGYDDAKSLLAAKNLQTDIVSLKCLNEFISLCDAVKAAVKCAKIGERRKHGLIGQTILHKNIVIQEKNVMMVLSQNFPDIDILCTTAMNKGKTLLGNSFLSQKEFDDLEDDCCLDLDIYHREDLLMNFIDEMDN